MKLLAAFLQPTLFDIVELDRTNVFDVLSELTRRYPNTQFSAGIADGGPVINIQRNRYAEDGPVERYWDQLAVEGEYLLLSPSSQPMCLTISKLEALYVLWGATNTTLPSWLNDGRDADADRS